MTDTRKQIKLEKQKWENKNFVLLPTSYNGERLDRNNVYLERCKVDDKVKIKYVLPIDATNRTETLIDESQVFPDGTPFDLSAYKEGEKLEPNKIYFRKIDNNGHLEYFIVNPNNQSEHISGKIQVDFAKLDKQLGTTYGSSALSDYTFAAYGLEMQKAVEADLSKQGKAHILESFSLTEEILFFYKDDFIEALAKNRFEEQQKPLNTKKQSPGAAELSSPKEALDVEHTKKIKADRLRLKELETEKAEYEVEATNLLTAQEKLGKELVDKQKTLEQKNNELSKKYFFQFASKKRLRKEMSMLSGDIKGLLNKHTNKAQKLASLDTQIEKLGGQINSLETEINKLEIQHSKSPTPVVLSDKLNRTPTKTSVEASKERKLPRFWGKNK